MLIDNRQRNLSLRDSIYSFALIILAVTPLFESAGRLLAYSAIVLSLLIQENKNFQILRTDLFLVVSIAFLLIVSSIFEVVKYAGSEFSFISAYFFLQIFYGLLIASIIGRRKLLMANERLVIIALLIGLPVHFFIIYDPSAINYFYDYTFYGSSHKTIGIINAAVIEGNYNGRFNSFAWEPGIMQMLINLGIYYRLQRTENKIDFYLILMICGIVLTRSTAGFAVCAIVLVNSGIFTKGKNILFFAAILPFVLEKVLHELSYQITMKLGNSDSFAARYDRMAYVFNDWDASDLLLGAGNVFYVTNLKFSSMGAWDSFGQMTQRFGLVFAAFVFLILFVANKKFLGAAIVIAVTFFSQTIWFAPFVASFYFKGCSDED